METAARVIATSPVQPAPATTPHLIPVAGRGLTDAEVRDRRQRGLGHVVNQETSRTYWEIVRDNLLTFINVTLITIGGVLIALRLPREAIIAAGLVILIGVIGIVQEVNAKRRLDRISLLYRLRATVIRNGERAQVDPGEVVQDDLLVIAPGDQIMVDGRFLGPGTVEIDESMLTGESDPVQKRVGDQLLSGGFCLSGAGTYVAEAVGAESFANQMTSGARRFRRALTPLQREVNLVIRCILLIAGGFLSLLIVGWLTHAYPFQDTVVAVAAILGIVPLGLFLTIMITYSLAAVRLAGQNALIQQLNAVESLSNVDVFCLDKTGTLTANRLTMSAISSPDVDETTIRRWLGTFARSVHGGTKTSDAIAAACPGQAEPVVDEVPFTSARKWSAVAADQPDFRGVFALGAPEMLAPLLADDTSCPMPPEWIRDGLRVLLFAHVAEPARLHGADGAPTLPAGMTPIAWVAFRDELRPNAREIIERFTSAGIALKMISGDHPDTVLALARQVGFPIEGGAMSGVDLENIPEDTWPEVIERTNVFGRITPDQKERIVGTLRELGHHVAMTGDGVNDVLSLKRANLGIAMESGSQMTRSAADIVLLGDSFDALPKVFQEGQRIRRGLQSILALYLTRACAAAVLLFAAGYVQSGFPLSPGHNALITLLTVGVPTLGIAVWAQPGPVAPSVLPELIRFVVPAMLLTGLAAFAVYALFYFWLAPPPSVHGDTASALFFVRSDESRSAVTTTLILCGLLLVPFAVPPTRFWAVVSPLAGYWRPTILASVMVIALALVVSVPWLSRFFDIMRLGWRDYLLIAGVIGVWLIALRWVWQTRLINRVFSP